MQMQSNYDVIVVGGGHAGTEAALAAARIGASTLLLTQNIDTIGQMSCNPSIGGIGKGHLVKEIDAMGGAMAQAIDRAGIHFRILNASKGPAVRATRAQACRVLYKQAIREMVEQQANLSVFQQSVDDVIAPQGKICGVITKMGLTFYAKAVVLTVGTFLGGRMHIGETTMQGGRAGDKPSNALAERLRALPFHVGRLKTGTPPRIDGRHIQFELCEEQHGDTPLPVFSFVGNRDQHPQQRPCYITRTTLKTKDIILKNIHRSPMYSGQIEGVGPRYCPSIEDKIKRFADKDTHQIFIEPEGLHTTEIYPNGISTSLPFDVQTAFVRSIVGFEKAHITRPGYAIEYDYFDPRDLTPTLETKYIQGLFFAGQINGTTGYEEAAAQGLLAGINAARQAAGRSTWYPRRDQAYLGVLVDDLITKGTSEPYRMFTSRAEYRLLLREDNADLRLTDIAYDLGLIDNVRYEKFCKKKQDLAQLLDKIKTVVVQPDSEAAQQLNKKLAQALTRAYHVDELLRRPELSLADLLGCHDLGLRCDDPDVILQVNTQAKYHGYIARQAQEIEKCRQQEALQIPEQFDYHAVKGLSSEVIEKLQIAKPATVGMASRVPGVTPAAISILLVSLKQFKHHKAANRQQDQGVSSEA